MDYTVVDEIDSSNPRVISPEQRQWILDNMNALATAERAANPPNTQHLSTLIRSTTDDFLGGGTEVRVHCMLFADNQVLTLQHEPNSHWLNIRHGISWGGFRILILLQAMDADEHSVVDEEEIGSDFDDDDEDDGGPIDEEDGEFNLGTGGTAERKKEKSPFDPEPEGGRRSPIYGYDEASLLLGASRMRNGQSSVSVKQATSAPSAAADGTSSTSPLSAGHTSNPMLDPFARLFAMKNNVPFGPQQMANSTAAANGSASNGANGQSPLLPHSLFPFSSGTYPTWPFPSLPPHFMANGQSSAQNGQNGSAKAANVTSDNGNLELHQQLALSWYSQLLATIGYFGPINSFCSAAANNRDQQQLTSSEDLEYKMKSAVSQSVPSNGSTSPTSVGQLLLDGPNSGEPDSPITDEVRNWFGNILDVALPKKG